MRLKREFCFAKLCLSLFSCRDDPVHFTDASAPAVTKLLKHLLGTFILKYTVMLLGSINSNSVFFYFIYSSCGIWRGLVDI